MIDFNAGESDFTAETPRSPRSAPGLVEYGVTELLRPLLSCPAKGTRAGVPRHTRLGDDCLERILVSGISGPIGRALLSSFEPELEPRGMQIVRLVRGRAENGAQVSWNSLTPLSPAKVSGFDAVVHLAGESIVGRWTNEKKSAIRDSRVLGTRHLSAALAETEAKPRVLVCASAIGFYGDRGDEILGEKSPIGRGFLPEVCSEWEDATRAAPQAGIRTV